MYVIYLCVHYVCYLSFVCKHMSLFTFWVTDDDIDVYHGLHIHLFSRTKFPPPWPLLVILILSSVQSRWEIIYLYRNISITNWYLWLFHWTGKRIFFTFYKLPCKLYIQFIRVRFINFVFASVCFLCLYCNFYLVA